MKSREEIEVKINSAMTDKDFIDQKYVASDEDIHTIEYQLGFRLPQSLVWFLKKYGSGGVNGSEIYGVGLPEYHYTIVNKTKRFMTENGLDKRWVLLGTDEDGWVFVMDAGNADSNLNDAPVIAYNTFYAKEERLSNSFYDFLDYHFGFAELPATEEGVKP
ncbi:SMI1/KNR4 family protein [Acidithiobacillus sp. IBUN Pt1247-S3]|uniref:SMI1/KNR4 family protein n=1 Tax=Acidithiobacillus sp. IBUN Pt1247-S3 TaxID=3166642 RepID=UPI0034E469A6